MTEQDTKNALVSPMLEALGWPVNDLERVRAEYRQTSASNPVDYALLLDGRPVMFVEAKALDRDISDHKFISQVLSYANVAGVDWALVTNGARWDLYSASPASRRRRSASSPSRSTTPRPWIASCG